MLVTEFNEHLSLPTKYNKVRNRARRSVGKGTRRTRVNKEESENTVGTWSDDGQGQSNRVKD